MLKLFVLFAPYVYFHIFSSVYVTSWPSIEKIAAHSAKDMFSWYECLIVNLVFSHLGFWRGILFFIVPFPDRCLRVPFSLVMNFIFAGVAFGRPRTANSLVCM